MSNGEQDAPIGVTPPPLTPSSQGNIEQYRAAEPAPGGAAYEYGEPGRELPPVEGKVIPAALAKIAFKPRAKLKLAHVKGKVNIPFGSRIAGLEGKRKIDLERLTATDAERLSILFFCENNIPFDFETELLGGRPRLNFVIAPFLLNEPLKLSDHQAMRFYEQASGRSELEADFLDKCGYKVIDISTVRLLNDVSHVMVRALELA